MPLVSFTYDAGGRLTQKWLPNGVTSRYAWNADGSLASVENRRSATDIVSAHVYSYDGVGNRVSHIESLNDASLTLTCAYDLLAAERARRWKRRTD